MSALLKQAIELINDLVGHLDYCGWGDAWERGCSEPLQDRARAFVDLTKPPVALLEDDHNYALNGVLVRLPTVCPQCARRFVTNKATRNHMRDKHNIRADRMLTADVQA